MYGPNSHEKKQARIFDTAVAALLVLWLLGGIPWKGKVLLAQGVDFRCAALLLIFAGAFWMKDSWRANSRVFQALGRTGQALQSSLVRWTGVLVLLLWIVGINLLQTLSLRISFLDVGVLHQRIWSASQGQVSSLWSSPSLFLVAPLFKITQGAAWTLPVLQSVAIIGGASAWIFFAERLPRASKEFRSRLAAATFVFILGFSSLWINLRWGFHENAIGFAALSWGMVLALLSEPKKIMVILLLLVAAASGDILLLNVSLLFGIFTLGLRARKEPLWAAWSLGLAATLLLLFFLQHAPSPAPSHLNGLQSLALIKNIFLPWIALPLLWLGWGLLPEGGGRARFYPLLLLSVIPSFISSLLSEEIPAHHFLDFWPVFAVLSLLALGECETRGISLSRFWIPYPLAWVWAFLSLLNFSQDPWNQMRSDLKEAVEKTPVRKHLLEIPSSARVVADEDTGPWLASRQYLARWPDFSALPGQCPDWIVVKQNELRSISQAGGNTAYQLSRCQLQGVLQGVSAWAPVWTAAGWTAYQLRRQDY